MSALTLTPFPSGTPAPYVQVDVDDVPVSASTLTAWRTAAGREVRVRGLVDVVADGASRQDFEAPFDVPLSYRLQYFDAEGGFLGWSDPFTTSLPEMSGAWFHNVLDPSTSVMVTELRSAANVLNRPIAATRLNLASRSVGVVLPSVRQGLTGVALDCLTVTLSDADKFDALFGGYDDSTIPIVCVRAPAAMRLPMPLIAFVASPNQVPLDTHLGGGLIRWELSADETQPPAEALVVALLSYADFTAFYTDYAAFNAAYGSYTEASRDYSIAGTA